MSSFPRHREILGAYQDQVEALARLWRARRGLTSDPDSRFHGQTEAELELRLRTVRTELDRATTMMLIASFEATVRSDAKSRIELRTRDAIRKPVRDLDRERGGRVRLEELLELWEWHAGIAPAVAAAARSLLRHRHWLAHGRYWTDKSAVRNDPLDIAAKLDDYTDAIRATFHDFPR